MNGRRTFVLTTSAAVLLTLAACGDQNHYVAPPPPKVTFAAPTRQAVTRYLELTGNMGAAQGEAGRDARGVRIIFGRT